MDTTTWLLLVVGVVLLGLAFVGLVTTVVFTVRTVSRLGRRIRRALIGETRVERIQRIGDEAQAAAEQATEVYLCQIEERFNEKESGHVQR